MKQTTKQTIKTQLLALSFLLCFGIVQAQNGSAEIRTKTNINSDWKYLENDAKKLSDINQSVNWVGINLPHTWNSQDATDNEPGYRRSASWYKKKLAIPVIDANKVYQLYFEGANITTKVYVNGNEVGEHIGGYIGFTFDITKYIKSGTNEIMVRVDNSYNIEIIPSQKSDFFIYGGITRDVWLLSMAKNHIEKIKITTPKVSEKSASLVVVVASKNSDGFSYSAQLTNPKGKVVATKKGNVSGSTTTITFNEIKNPELWDIDQPNLYTVTISLLENGKITDKIEDRLGFRWFEFKENGPFYLNGKRVLIRGTHRHEEHAGVGAAVSNEQHRKDMESIKEMGANFVRLAHYPQDPEVYKACDELGLLVWDELPWCRGGVGNEVWQTNAKNMLTEMINQNFNHPSIIIWSLGNEMYWLPDFPGGDNPEKMNSFLGELNTLAHQLDPSRKTALRKYEGGATIVDIFSPSIWSGWYSGSFKSYQKAIDKYKLEYKHFLHAEYGGDSQVGRHSEKPINGEGIFPEGWEEAIVQGKGGNIAQIGDWSESYIVDLFDWHLNVAENDPTFVGNIQWAFKDFGTPLRPEDDIPYMNQKGLVDRNGNPKDAYYVFKSYWSDKPFAYIESHTWTERQGPKELARVLNVFSNCPKVEFFHNGISLGVKERNIKLYPACGLTWDVNFTEGKNTFVAIGFTNDGKKVSDTIDVKYRFTKNEPAIGLKMTGEKLKNGNYLFTALAVDKNNLRCLDFEDRVYFQCLSGGQTMKNQGTPTGSESIKMANGKAAIEVIPDANAEKIIMNVLSQNFKGEYVEVKKN
jgi:beta-galactosidase